MRRVRKRPALIGIFVLLLTFGSAAAWFVLRDRKDAADNAGVSFVSAVDTAKTAIKGGVTSSNADQALFVATDLVNSSKTAEARTLVTAISDEILSNDQLKNKYTILLDSYKLDGNKESFSATVQSYKSVIASRNDNVLTQATSYLTPEYVEAVFTPQPVVPENEEVP